MRNILLSTILIILLSAVSAVPTNAQSLMERMAKKAAEKLEQKTEDRIDRKVDQSIDKGLDNIEESASANQTDPQAANKNSDAASQKRMENFLGKLGISSEPVKYADAYTFNASMRINIKTFGKNGKLKSDGEMVSYLSDNNKYMAYEFVSGDINVDNAPKNKGIFILDYANQATLILSEDNHKKTGVAYGLTDGFEDGTYGEEVYADTEASAEDVDWDYTASKLKKTGRTKNILGYKCEEYEFSDEESKGAVWITKDYKAARSTAVPSMFNWTALTYGQTSGFLMASESTDLKSGEKSTMEVTEINNNRNTSFNTQQYEITNLGSIGMAEN